MIADDDFWGALLGASRFFLILFKILFGAGGGVAAAGGAVEETLLEEVGFDDVFNRVFTFAGGGGEGFNADGAAVEFVGQAVEIPVVVRVQASGVNFEFGEGVVGDSLGDGAFTCDFGEVPHAAEETVGNAGRAAGAFGDLMGAGGVNLDVEEAGGAGDDVF